MTGAINRVSDLNSAFGRALTWLEENGWAGYDPYDVRGTSLFLWLNRNRLTSTAFKAFSFFFPQLTRTLLHVPRTVNAKAVALIAHAWLDIWAGSGRPEYLSRARQALTWLETHSSPGYSGLCWGYPFDWDNRTFIPAGTPSSVVTSIAAEAFLRAYELLAEDHYLEVARGCAAFIAQDLQRDEHHDQIIGRREEHHAQHREQRKWKHLGVLHAAPDRLALCGSAGHRGCLWREHTGILDLGLRKQQQCCPTEDDQDGPHEIGGSIDSQ